MKKSFKIIILFLLFLNTASCVSDGEFYKKSIGITIGNTGIGAFSKAEPECEHTGTIKMLKEESLKNAQNWRRLAYGTSIFSFVCLVVWYLTKIPEIGGVSVISIVFSLFSTFMATLVTISWLIVLIGIAILLVALGIYLHKKSFFSWLKEKKKCSSIKQQ